MLNGILFFAKQLDSINGRWLGYIYCPTLEKPFFVNEQRMVKGASQPLLGAALEFKEGAKQEGKEFAAANAVRVSAAFYAPDEPLFPLDIVAAIYRLSPHIIRTRLTTKLLALHEEAGKALLSFAQVQVLADWQVRSAGAQKSGIGQSDPPDSDLRFGQLVRHEFDRGFGFVKEQGKGKSEIFAHVKNLKFEPKLNEWLVFAVGADGRVSWARKPAQVLSWLQKNYAAFSVDALDELLRLDNQELADNILTFRVERILAAKPEARLSGAVGMLQRVRNIIPQKIEGIYERLILSLENADKMRLWAQFGNPKDAPSFVDTLDEVYQRTLSLQTADMPRNEMLGLLDLGKEKANAEAAIQAWWPAREIGQMTEAEQIEAISSLFKWLREWHICLSTCHLTPAERVTRLERWRMLSDVIHAHFAIVGGVTLGTAIYEATGVLLPVPELIREKVEQLPEKTLLNLVRSGGETGYLALAVALRRLGKIDTEAAYESLRKWLSRIKPLQTDNPEWMKVVMGAVNDACSSVYRLNLWNAGFLPGLDWKKITGCLEIEAARIVAFDSNNKDDLRLAAARRVIDLELLNSSTAHNYVFNFLHQLSGKYPINSRIIWNPNGWKWQKAPLNQAAFAALVRSVLDGGYTQLQHSLWKAGIIETPAFGRIYDAINFCSNGFDRSGDASAWEPAHELIRSLNELQRLDFLDWMLNWNHISEVAGWNNKLLHNWLDALPETAEKQAIWSRLLTELTTPALLKLWLADVIEHYEFDAYRLLVFTLSPTDQILFLRKTFKLLATGELQLTAGQLNSITRYSRDELGGGTVLDYSVDLALAVLGSLARDGSLLSERDIVEVICRYIGENTTSLSLVGKELFSSCPGRSEVEKIRAPHKDVIKGRVQGVEYPASTDRKRIFIEDVAFDVTNDTVELSDSTERVSWVVTPGYDYQPGSNDLKTKPEGITLCEGRLAYKADIESQLPFWWCCNRPCFKPNQGERSIVDWQHYTLADFISILNLPFNADAYYTFVGLINRVNRLLARLQCRCCDHVLRPIEQSDFNFYRANRFKCTNRTCKEQEREVYLSHCLNGHCLTVIDSRDSKRCSYRTEGSPGKQGMYICAKCGGCCSKQALLRRKENLEKTYMPEMLANHAQYRLIRENLDQRLYHWERMRVFCHKCTKPMQQRHPQANYTCPDCHIEYRLDMAHVEVARRKNLVEEEA